MFAGGGNFAEVVETLLEKEEGEIANLVQRIGYHWARVPVP